MKAHQILSKNLNPSEAGKFFLVIVYDIVCVLQEFDAVALTGSESNTLAMLCVGCSIGFAIGYAFAKSTSAH
jgi:hypothetical protein